MRCNALQLFITVLGEVALVITRWLVQALEVVAMFESDTGKSQKRPKGKSSGLPIHG